MTPPPTPDPSPTHGMALVGIDWGTTHRRCYRLGARGALQAEQADDQGLLAASGPGWFRAALDSALAAWPDLPGDAPVLMSGMVGSAQGWHPVPYLGLETPLSALGEHLFALPDGPAGRRGAIVPGYAMRLADGTLAPLMAQGRDSPSAFERGLRAAAGGSLSNLLFGVRARVVAGAMPAAEARDQVSGLLVGAEWHAALQREGGAIGQVSVIGVPALAERHRQAGALLGVAVELIDPHQAYVAALARLRAFL